jgi:hypothetical protein
MPQICDLVNSMHVGVNLSMERLAATVGALMDCEVAATACASGMLTGSGL